MCGEKMSDMFQINHTLDAIGLSCGDLVLAIFNKMKEVQEGEILQVITYDLGAIEDVPAWCRMQGHSLLYVEETGIIQTHFIIQKG